MSGMEACAGSHYWTRELTGQGQTVRLIADQFVSLYRKSGKNDRMMPKRFVKLLAAKHARIIWAMLARNQGYRTTA
jgi:transposase